MHFTQNLLGRDFVVGDIHGEYDLLMNKLQEIDFNFTKDRLFSVGDLVDRGLKSVECLLLTKQSWFHPVCGNHERMLVECYTSNNSEKIAWWCMNGGSWHLDVDWEIMFDLVDICNSLPVIITVETPTTTIGIVHAEPKKTWHETLDSDEEHLLWSRTKIRSGDKSFCEGISLVYCGHTPLKEVTQLGNVRFIDTGAFHTKILTIEELK